MTLINRIKISLGSEICEKCGSENVLQQGFEETNHRHYCGDCEHTTVVMQV